MNAIYNISIENKKKNTRYLLGKLGNRPLIVFGINPSSADMNQSDPTMRRIDGFIKNSKYDGFMMCNVFPLRAKNPSKLPEKFGWREEEKCAENVKWICKQLEQVEEPVIWAAWGEGIMKRKYLVRCLFGIWKMVEKFGAKWVYCGGLTIHGHPRHPLYLPGDATFQDFDMGYYILSRTLKW